MPAKSGHPSHRASVIARSAGTKQSPRKYALRGGLPEVSRRSDALPAVAAALFLAACPPAYSAERSSCERFPIFGATWNCSDRAATTFVPIPNSPPAGPAPSIQVQESALPLEESWWEGSYSCAQGPTALRLGTLASADGTVEALFEFGPLAGNSTVPSGSFLLKGSIRRSDGFLELLPVRWISRPAGYVMVGLAGVVSGNTFSGAIVGGYACTNFRVTRQSTETHASVPTGKTASISSAPTFPDKRPCGDHWSCRHSRSAAASASSRTTSSSELCVKSR